MRFLYRVVSLSTPVCSFRSMPQCRKYLRNLRAGPLSAEYPNAEIERLADFGVHQRWRATGWSSVACQNFYYPFPTVEDLSRWEPQEASRGCA